jgi:hypothetical protein
MISTITRGAAWLALAALAMACAATTDPIAGASAEDADETTGAIDSPMRGHGCGCPRVPTCEAGCDPECVEPGRYLRAGPVVIDMRASGRQWQRSVAPRALAFDEAVAYCTHLSLGCHASGWRLPSVDELRSLLYKPGGLQAGRPGYCDPAIDQAAFPGTPSDHHWTSHVDRARGEATWVNFFDGRQHTDVIDTAKSVRCVHDP